MSEMVERIAKAIYDARHPPEERGKEPFKVDRVMARAAIEAMREPTEAMLEVDAYLTDESPTRDIWVAMIDATLKD